ncbi:permease [Oceanobacillus piezotolerans]|uniref:Permease n=1 Tax=Oceanobacillus piezotolerans TaxID=2448030 RepID=A0A498DG59_9BACI|nr:cytosine permease [Oceanobacillus piezotolerans]RLL43612.1 permease [Oceanobacillus piezotolerans]
MENKEIVVKDEALQAVPENHRQHWITPTVIFGGLEFSIPVLMVGATLAASFGMTEILLILIIALFVIQWIGNTIQGYMGAKTGRSSSVIARSSFGALQSRFIVGLSVSILCLCWWAVQTAVAGNSISVMLGIDYTAERGMWALITIISGVLFALPAIFGYNSMKWTDYIAVPAGLLLVFAGIYYALHNIGWEMISSWNPEPTMTIAAAISIIIGVNVSQWVTASDYTRYAKPTIKDNILIPTGVVLVGFPLFLVGAIMSVGVGDADIVNVMINLGFPFWGFLILWIATWTSQIVNSYSMGLALSNMFNMNSNKTRALLTTAGTVVAIIIALAGILDHFMDLLSMAAIIYPAVAGVMMVDYFFIRKQTWQDNEGWNWMATIALVAGMLVGYVTQYVAPVGIPAIQSIVATGIVYYIAMKIKAQVAPDHFTG